jgi:hypothetical protein
MTRFLANSRGVDSKSTVRISWALVLHLLRAEERWPIRPLDGFNDNPSLVRRDLYVTNLRAGAARSSVFRGIAWGAYGLPPMYSTEHFARPARAGALLESRALRAKLGD